MLAAMLLVALACDAPAPTNVGRGDVAVREQATTKASAAAAERAETLLKRAESTPAEAAGVLRSMGGTAEPEVKMYGQITLRPGKALPDSVRPLVLIDGAPTNLSEIDPNTIESVDIYKGDKAVERYGARGAHGVISIVTKQDVDGGRR
jgi:pimeloyl-ACP methyl ester carboxylesterase